jgi:hypothetical protein
MAPTFSALKLLSYQKFNGGVAAEITLESNLRKLFPIKNPAPICAPGPASRMFLPSASSSASDTHYQRNQENHQENKE